MSAAVEVPSVLRWLLYSRGGACECAGECGRRHSRDRCEAAHPLRLVAAPADPSVSVTVAAAVPPEELQVWCRDCLHDARRRLGVTAAQPDLFEGWSA